MITLLKGLFLSIIFLFAGQVTFAQDLSVIGQLIPEKVDQYSIYVGLVVLVWEYLVANSKMKSNSTIDLIINGIKKLLRLERYDK